MTERHHSLAELRTALYDPRISPAAPVVVRVVDRSRRASDGSHFAIEYPIIGGITSYHDGHAAILAEAKSGDLARAAAQQGRGNVADEVHRVVDYLSRVDTDLSGASEGWRAGAREALGALDRIADTIAEMIELLRADAGGGIVIDDPPMRSAPADTRIVYGARCTWWDSIDKVGAKPSGLPCCPHCGGVLFECPTEELWWAQSSAYTALGPRYLEYLRWSRGARCYPDRDASWAAFLEAQSGRPSEAGQ